VLADRGVRLGIVLLALAAVSAGCASSGAFRQGQKAAAVGDWETAATMYTKAVQDNPGRTEYRIQLERAMIEASRIRLDRARRFETDGNLESAIVEYRRVLEYNPGSREALARVTLLEKQLRDRLEATRPKPAIEQMRQRARQQSQPPLLNPASREPISLRFTQVSTQDILNFIGNAAGINVTFEKDFRPVPFSIQLEGVTLEEALNQIMTANQLWYKVINERTILVIPEQAQKRQLYEEQVIRTFYISYADPQELSQLIGQVTRVPGLAIQPTVALSKTSNTITIRATRGMAEIIERVIQANDRPRAEVLIDVDILEVSRVRAKQYGLNLGDYSVGMIFSPEVAPGGGTATTPGGSTTATAVPPFNLNTIVNGISAADFYMTVPTAIAKFLATDSQTRQIAKPQLRGQEGVKLTLNLGDEIPVPSTVFTPIAAGGTSVNPLTSFSYRPVGVNLEVTPRVTYEGDIILDVQVESSNLGDNVLIAGQALPSFGSRKVTSRIRLREGESNLLAGLIGERERKSLRGIPGIMNLPFFKQLLSDNDTSNQQVDLVIILTPRVLRSHELTQEDLAPIHIGTQQNISPTGGPQFLAPSADPVPDAPAPAPRPGEIGLPSPTAAPGMPGATVAAPPGMPTGATSAAPGVAGGARLPDGAGARPVTPPGSSPIPGTTVEPSPPVASPPPQPQAPVVPPAPEPATVPETAPPVPPVEPRAEVPAAAQAQLVLTVPATEFRVGGGPYLVPISIVGVSRASTVSLSVTYNPAALRVRAVQEGSFLRQGGIQVGFTQQVDPSAGRVDISLTRTGDSAGASGAGQLAAILFEPVAPGTAVLQVNGLATTPQGQPMPLAVSPATITVK
jgi:type II secretory pathway component GspD/PulD (secretin)